MKKQGLFLIIILLWNGFRVSGAGDNDRKPVGIDFFKEVKMLSNLKEKNGHIYFIIKQADVEENLYTSDLFLLENGQPRRLTSSHDIGDYYLLDDGSILFKNAREAKDRERIRKGEPLSVYVKLSPQIGEAVEALRLPYAVGDIKFIDEKHFFFTAGYDHNFARLLEQADNDLDKALKEKEKNSGYRIFDEIPFWANGRGDISGKRTHLYFYNEGDIKELSAPFETVGGLTLSEDKQTLLYTSNTYQGKAPRGNRLKALQVAGLTVKDITPLEETASYGNISFLSADAVLLTIHTAINEISNASFYRLHLKTRQLDKLYSGDPYGAGNSTGSDVKMGNTPSGIRHDKTGFYYITTVADHAPLIQVAFKDAAVSFINKGKESILEYLPHNDGFLTIAMTGNQAAEICYLDKKGSLTPLSHINDRLQTEFRIITPQPLTFRNENGTEITGYAIPPADYEKGKKYPTILDIHGGPKTVFSAGLFHEMQYWANQGYAVIFTNPTGSDGGGNAFANIKGRYGETDYRDLMTFTDAAIEAFDFIDADRVGVTGGSYGGFMTNWIIGHTNRFRAAASQRSIASWISFSNTTDIGYTFIQSQIGGDAWTNHEGLWAQSPLKYADQVKTPTLFIHSEEDYRCWLSEGIQMFYALKYFDVPSRLVIFENENHELSRSGRPQNRIKRLQEITTWMDTYLR
ncbi:MAG: S9 family peptidase [Tannerellaceae bacterium]|jgi:dipeptidyl aminopeptidase/acylaminoacyl peptidase|nr:S9 family peptidase [Tannerellaceae bacterium]